MAVFAILLHSLRADGEDIKASLLWVQQNRNSCGYLSTSLTNQWQLVLIEFKLLILNIFG